MVREGTGSGTNNSDLAADTCRCICSVRGRRVGEDLIETEVGKQNKKDAIRLVDQELSAQ